jgi:hypothetical protein
MLACAECGTQASINDFHTFNLYGSESTLSVEVWETGFMSDSIICHGDVPLDIVRSAGKQKLTQQLRNQKNGCSAGQVELELCIPESSVRAYVSGLRACR